MLKLYLFKLTGKYFRYTREALLVPSGTGTVKLPALIKCGSCPMAGLKMNDFGDWTSS